MTPTFAHFALFLDGTNDIEYNVLYDTTTPDGDLTIFHAGTTVSFPLSKLEWLREVLFEIHQFEEQREEEAARAQFSGVNHD